MTTTYRNPWHNGRNNDYGPAFYSTEAKPTEYRGFLIYHANPKGWDIVKDGVCISQRAGFDGAKRFIDKIYDDPSDCFVERALSYLSLREAAAA